MGADPLWMREDWKIDSLKWRGEVLKGEYAHWCHEWDGLPVDETTDEFTACTCFPDDTHALALQFLVGMTLPVPEPEETP